MDKTHPVLPKTFPLAGRIAPILPLVLLALVFAGGGGKNLIVWHGAGFLSVTATIALLWSHKRFSFAAPLVFPAILASLAWAVVSALNSPSVGASLQRLADFAAFLSFGLLVFYFVGETERGAIRCFVIAAGIVQSLAWAANLLMQRASFALLPGNPVYSIVWTMAAILLALGYACSPAQTRPRNILRWSAGCWAVFASFILFFMSSRAALISIAIALGYFAARRFGRRGLIGFAVVVMVVLAAVPAERWSGVLKQQDPLSLKRLSIWRSALIGVGRKPFLGWGPGQFETLYRRHAQPNDDLPVRYGVSTPWAHNDYLQLTAEWGTPAAVFSLWGVGWAFFRRRVANSLEIGEKAAGLSFATAALVNFPLALPVNGLLAAYFLTEPYTEAKGGMPTKTAPSIFRRGFLASLTIFALLHGLRAASETLWMAGKREIAQRIDPWNVDRLLSDAERNLHPAESAPNVSASEETLLRLLRHSPTSADAWHLLSHLRSVHQSPPRAEEALVDLRNALIWAPTYAPWHVELAQLLEEVGEIKGARLALHEALRNEPLYSDAALRLGRLMTLSREGEKAERWLSSALRHHETAREHWSFSSGQMSGILSSGYGRTITTIDRPAFGREIARSQLSQRKPALALETLRETRPPENIDRWFLEAAVYQSLGQISAARNKLKHILKIHPRHPEALKRLETLR